jgi:hypothetical protein
VVLILNVLTMSSSSSAPDASTKGPISSTPHRHTSSPSDRDSPPTVIPDGEDAVLIEEVKGGPPPLALFSEDLSPPQPQPQPEPEHVLEPEPEPDPAAIAAEAEKLKEQGNESFKRARYDEAVDLYTKAIGMSSSSSSFPLPFHP